MGTLTLESKGQVGQLPNLLIVIEDAVLEVVFDHVLLDQSVVDHRWLYRLFVLLNPPFPLKLFLDVHLHRRPTHIHCR